MFILHIVCDLQIYGCILVKNVGCCLAFMLKIIIYVDLIL